jgi:quinohemoprotein amine dehydrogenase beta subunit
MTKLSRLFAGALVGALFALALQPVSGEAKEYILAGAKPNQLHLIDAKARKVERSYDIPGRGGPLTFSVSPDGNRAYVLSNGWESIFGFDLDSGKIVFRADFSEPGLRVKGMFGMTLSRDGKEIYVIQSPVKLGLGEYEVQDIRVAVYDTGAGVKAKPVRSFPVPRRSILLHMSTDNSKLYVVGFDILALDPKTGKQTGVHKVTNWERPNFFPPDVLGVWGQYEQAEVYINPYFTARSDMSLDNPEAWSTGMMTLDLASGTFEMKHFEFTEVIIFSAVVNPKRRNESFGVYTTLSKVDHEAGKLLKRINLDHTYYGINISSDGSELYLGGTMNDIAIYSSDTLEKLGEIRIPGGVDQALPSVRVFNR